MINSMIDGYIYVASKRKPKGAELYSFTDIYNAIKEKHPKVGKDTIQRHLNKMVEEHILIRLPKEKAPKGRRYNKTLYTLDDKSAAYYLARLIIATAGYEKGSHDGIKVWEEEPDAEAESEAESESWSKNPLGKSSFPRY